MKQKLFLTLALLMTFCSYSKADNVLIAEIDWTKQSAYYSGVWYNSEYATLKVSSNGLEYDNNPPDNADYWASQVPMLAHIPYLQAGGNYQVTFTVDAPAAGELRLDLCSWDGAGGTSALVFNVEKGEQEYTIDFNNYPASCTDAMIFYQCGKISGKHIIKKVEIWGPEDNNREAYAVYDETNKLLTFYYDSNQEGKTGELFPLNTGQNLPGWHDKEIVTVVFHQSFSEARPTTTRAWFEEQKSLEGVGNLEFLNTSEVTDMGWMFYGCEKLKYIRTKNFDTSKVTNMSSMFCNCGSLTTLDLGSFNTSKVTNMTDMFCWCNFLNTIYVSTGWDTSKVTESNNMFFACNNIKGGTGTLYDEGHVNAAYARIDGGESNPGYLTERPSGYAVYYDKTLTFYNDGKMDEKPGDESNKFLLNIDNYEKPGWLKYDNQITKVVFDESFATARPVCTYSWFEHLNQLSTIEGIVNLNTSKVTDMVCMFNGCGIPSLDLSHFNTQNVTSMIMMFFRCENLTTLDLSSFDTSNVTNMMNMFNNCRNLEELNLSSFDTQNVTNMMMMFSGCNKLKTIYVGEKWDTENVEVHYSMFSDCENLEGENGTTYDTKHLDKEYAHIDGAPDNPGYLSTVPPVEAYAVLSSTGKTLTFYYDNKKKTRQETGTVYPLNTGYSMPGWYKGHAWDEENPNKITKVVFNSSFKDARPTSTCNWFYEQEQLTKITGIAYLNTSLVTNMCSMFNGCKSLTSLTLSKFKTSKVTDMSYMFYDCGSLTKLDVSKFNTSKVKNMVSMFTYCSSLTSLDLSNFDTSNITDMSSMFESCESLTSLDVSSFNTSKVKYMWGMFCNCTSLTSLDISSFDTSNVVDMSWMFYNNNQVTTIYVGDLWNTNSLSDTGTEYGEENGWVYLFENCRSLIGEQGTTFDANHIDKEYARIDGGPTMPGYFSSKPSGITTGESLQVTSDKVQVTSEEWYTIDGQKLNGVPAKKGIYIHNGNKQIVR